MSHPQRFREIGETIESGDICRTIEGHQIPAEHSIGRKVRPENVGFVLTTKPHTLESEVAMLARLRKGSLEAYEVQG